MSIHKKIVVMSLLVFSCYANMAARESVVDAGNFNETALSLKIQTFASLGMCMATAGYAIQRMCRRNQPPSYWKSITLGLAIINAIGLIGVGVIEKKSQYEQDLSKGIIALYGISLLSIMGIVIYERTAQVFWQRSSFVNRGE